MFVNDRYNSIFERIKSDFEQGKQPNLLMDEMELIFNVPAMNDENYNSKNKEVIELYKAISNSRDFNV